MKFIAVSDKSSTTPRTHKKLTFQQLQEKQLAHLKDEVDQFAYSVLPNIFLVTKIC